MLPPLPRTFSFMSRMPSPRPLNAWLLKNSICKQSWHREVVGNSGTLVPQNPRRKNFESCSTRRQMDQPGQRTSGERRLLWQRRDKAQHHSEAGHRDLAGREEPFCLCSLSRTQTYTWHTHQAPVNLFENAQNPERMGNVPVPALQGTDGSYPSRLLLLAVSFPHICSHRATRAALKRRAISSRDSSPRSCSAQSALVWV